MVYIHVPSLSQKCEDFIKNNEKLKLSKFIYKNGAFVFYREYTHYVTKVKNEFHDFKILLARNQPRRVGWCVSYKRHTGKWQDLPIFGDFDYCLDEIKSGKWGILNPI